MEYGDDKPLKDAKAGAKIFVNLMGSSDRAEVISFADYVTIDQSFISDKQALYDAIDSLYSDGGTALYDAIWQGLDDTAEETNPRKAVVALTDGGENSSCSDHGGGDPPDNSELIGHAQKLKIPIYTIGLAGFDFTREKVARNYSTTEADLNEIGKTTGGDYFYAPTSDVLKNIYEEITQRLEQQYIITFTDNTGITDGILTVKVNYNQMYGENSKEYKPPAQEYKGKVEVYGNSTLNVRENYGTDANIIGKKFWGSIGTLIDGPKEADGYTWLKVKWDNDENVPGETGSYYKPESGWSVEDYLWSYDTDRRVRGVDISQWNKIDNWHDIFESGRRFALIKATEGQKTYNDLLNDYVENALNAGNGDGLFVGVYHLGRPDMYPDGAIKEAEWFFDNAEDYLKAGYLKPALDLEAEYVNKFITNGSYSSLASWVNTWMEEVKLKANLTSYPILYCSQDYASRLYSADPTHMKEYPLWIADYSNNESPDTCGWSNWAFRQYAGHKNAYWAGRGRCPGFAVDAGVDLDIFNGSIEELEFNFLIK